LVAVLSEMMIIKVATSIKANLVPTGRHCK